MSSTSIVFGTKAVLEAILAGKTIDKIFLDKDAKGIDYQNILKASYQSHIPCSRVPYSKLNKFTSRNHQGVVAVLSSAPLATLSHVIQTTYEQGQLPLIVILDSVTDVGNVGAIIRTAVCVGAHALVIPMRGSASLGDAAMRTSAGALAHLPICREYDLQASIKYLRESGLHIIGCHEKSQHSIYETNLKVPVALLFGAEDKGIHPQLLHQVDKQVSIPMVGPVRSLNVSVAAAIILYETYRQRNNSR